MSTRTLSLANKVAIVTGGRRGIGKAIALTFAEAGADVAICDSMDDGGELEAVEGGIKGFGRQALAMMVDVTRRADVQNLVKAVKEKFGGIDILVNCAGILMSKRSPVLETSDEDWDNVMGTNLKGCFICCQEVGKVMVERRSGSIISLASVAGIRPLPNIVAYNVSKAGVITLTRSLALELAGDNIRVNAIAPWMIKTKMTERARSNPTRWQYVLNETPMGHIGETSDVASVALFLASDITPWITGHTIVLDGGYTAGDFGSG